MLSALLRFSLAMTVDAACKSELLVRLRWLLGRV
jgi:hypothetical protein